MFPVLINKIEIFFPIWAVYPLGLLSLKVLLRIVLHLTTYFRVNFFLTIETTRSLNNETYNVMEDAYAEGWVPSSEPRFSSFVLVLYRQEELCLQ